MQGCLLIVVVGEEGGKEGDEGNDEVGNGERAREPVLGGLRLRHPHWPHLENALWGNWAILRDNVTF